MKKVVIMPFLVLLVLGGATMTWSQTQMPNGYWYRSNTTIDKLHEDYRACAGKNETQCMQAKGYKWVTEAVNPGYWFKPNTPADKVHADYKACEGQNEVQCMKGKGYEWKKEGLEQRY